MGVECSTYEEKSGAYRICYGDLREGTHLEDTGVDGRIISKWIFKKWDGACNGLSLLRIGRGGGLF
jgi:hypothetical protein